MTSQVETRMTRTDGLTPGKSFVIVTVYEREGKEGGQYYTSILGLCRDDVIAKVYKRTHNLQKSLVACSIPFEGKWSEGIPDVSLPDDFKETFVNFENSKED